MQRNSLPRGDFVQGVVDMRQMIRGDVAHEGAGDFVVAHAAVQPAQEKDELHGDGNECGQDRGPVDGHVGALEVKEVNEVEEVEE